MSLQGQIEEMGLGAVIQTLSLNRYRGTLRIESEEAGSQFFFISEGEIVLVRQVQRDPVRLGDLLVRAGKLSMVQLDEALAKQKKMGGKRLGECLVELELVTQEEIERVIRGKFEDEFLDLFLLDRGRFEFIFGLTPEALFAPEEKLERVTLNTSGLMLEAMRRLDEWQEMIKSIGSLDTIYKNRVGTMGASIVDYEFKEIHLPGKVRVELYELMDGTRSVREVLGTAIRSRLASRMETFQYLFVLKNNELIRSLDFKTLFGGAKSALEGGDVPGAAKYIRAILGQKGSLDIGLIKRYLGFLKKYKRPRLAFDEAKTFAAACLSRDETEHAIALYEEAVSLEFKNVEVLDRLFYALLRANRRDRAIEVGVKVRDYLGSDEAVGVASRIANNLRELDPENPEVIELSGLVLRRQERIEDALKELERALEKGGEKYPRRRALVSALLELQPERMDLRDEREALEVRAARDQLQREFRRRLTIYAAVLVGFIVVWRVFQEFRARSAYAQAQEVIAAGLTDVDSYGRASKLLEATISCGITTVGGAAQEQKDQLDQQWRAKLAQVEADRQRADDERRQLEQAREAEQQRLSRGLAFQDALAEYHRLVTQQDWPGASAKALAVRAEFAALGDARLSELRVFCALTSAPPGAEAFVGEDVVGVTPCAVPVELGGQAHVTVRLRGYTVAEETLAGGGFQQKAVTLTPGPSWRVQLPRAPLPALALSEKAVIVAEAGGTVSALNYADGHVRWTLDVSGNLAPLGDAGVPFALAAVAAAGRYAVVASSQAVAGIDVATGQVEWRFRLSGAPARPSLVAARLRTQDVVLHAAGTSLVVYDAASGTPVQRLVLPAAVAQPPAVGDTLAFVALVGGRLAAYDISKSDGVEVWHQEGVQPTAPPIHSELTQSVLVQEGERLRSFGVADGAPLATLEPQLGRLLGAALSNERLFALGEGGLLAAMRAYDGQLLVRATRVARNVSGGPVVVNQDVFVADGGGELLQLSPSARPRATRVTLGGALTAPLVANGGRIFALVDRTVLLVEPIQQQ